MKRLILWLSEPSWVNRLTLYALPLVPLIVLRCVFFLFVRGGNHDPLPVVGTLVKVEGALLAVIMIQSLVSIQSRALSYSVTIRNRFRRLPDPWIIMGIYLIVMLYGLSVLEKIRSADSSSGTYLMSHVMNVYFLGVFSSVALILYVFAVFRVAEPSQVVSLLARDMTKEKLLAAIDKKRTGPPGEDPLLSLVDIALNSVLRQDRPAVRSTLDSIMEHVCALYRDRALMRTEGIRIFSRINIQMLRIERVAADIGDYESISDLFNLFDAVARTAAEHGHSYVTMGVVHSLEGVGVTAASRRDDLLAKKTVEVLASLGSYAAGSGHYYEMTRVVRSVESVGKALSYHGLELSAFSAISVLEKLGVIAGEQRLKMPTVQVVRSLEALGNLAAGKGLAKASWMVLQSLRRLQVWLRDREDLGFAAHQADTASRMLSEVMSDSKVERQ